MGVLLDPLVRVIRIDKNHALWTRSDLGRVSGQTSNPVFPLGPFESCRLLFDIDRRYPGAGWGIHRKVQGRVTQRGADFEDRL